MTYEYLKYWGKVQKCKNGELNYHLLPYHCLDVAAVGTQLVERLGIAERIANKTGCTQQDIISFVTFLCAIHDIGKLSDEFQNQYPLLVKSLRGVSLKAVYQEKHWSSGHRFLRKYADRIFSGNKDDILDLLDSWFCASAAHHGRPSIYDSGVFPVSMQFPVVDTIDYINTVRSLFSVSDDSWSMFTNEQIMKELSWTLAGLVILSDWIGSDTRWFAFQESEQSLKDYWETKALPQAKKAVIESGVFPVSAASSQSYFQLFNVRQVTPLQALVEKIEITGKANLFIIEEITGAGKTEAALMLAHHIMSAGQADGIYFGLPTMATANAMHERVEKVYRSFFDGTVYPSLILAHSASRQCLPLENSNAKKGCEQENENTAQDAKAWLYDSRKKALLAHFGVGTIDQGLLSILPARHQSLRLLGLQRKVLIVDEVHAYDSYVNKLLCTLLKFHAAQGGNAILLSATLPTSVRQQFLAAFADGIEMHFDEQYELNKQYPLVTAIAGNHFSETPITSPVRLEREVAVTSLFNESDIVSRIKAIIATGRNVCWVRNTVYDAQKAYERLKEELAEDRIILFHARFALGDRLRIEKEIIKHFGKDSTAANRSGKVVIATQVIEQSLDIDFDYMITDLAPIDLIIQRAGRLCRHSRDEQGNPAEKEKRGTPELIVFMPSPAPEVNSDWYKSVFPKAARVYEHHGQLWLTAHWLNEKGKFRMPQDARDMIESIYGQDAQNNIPEKLRYQENSVGGADRAKAGVAQFQALKLEFGYMPDAMHWLKDEKVPTRLGELRTTVRLARFDNQKLKPYFQSEDENDWMLSEVSVAHYQIATENEIYRKEIDAAKSEMVDKGKYSVVIPLAEKRGEYIGTAVNSDGKPMQVLYDNKRGLCVKREGETDESDK